MSAPDTSHTRRRWLRLNTRGLLLQLALIAMFLAWLGGERRFVQHRALAQREVPWRDFVPVYRVRKSERQIYFDKGGEPRIPFWREWLGDRAVAFITLPAQSSEVDAEPDPDLKRFRRLFPEAYVGRWQQPELAESRSAGAPP